MAQSESVSDLGWKGIGADLPADGGELCGR